MGEGFLRHHASVIDQELRREIVGAVDNKIVILDEVEDVVAGDEGMVSNDLYIGVHRFHSFFCGLYLGLAHVGRSMDNLTLQIRKVHHVGVGNTDGSHTCCGKVHGYRCSETTCTNHENLRVQKLLLALRTNLFQDDVAGIALQLFVGKSH